LASIRYGLRLPPPLERVGEIAAAVVTAATGLASLSQRPSSGAVEVGKTVTRDEPVERHPARHEKIDEQG
jgi:hypothetical protein